MRTHSCRGQALKGRRGPRDVTKKSIPQLKRVLWDKFSLFIRQRDHENGCISCGEALELGTQNCQAGHFVPKGKGGSHYLALPRYPNDEWVEMNVNAQCARCNLMEGGNFLNYEKGLEAKYGGEKTEELKKMGRLNPIHKLTRSEYIEIIEYYA